MSSERIVVERMAGEEEADGVVFLLQPLGRQPGAAPRGSASVSRAAAPPNRSFCPIVAASCARCAAASIASTAAAARARLRLDAVERAGGGEAFQHALVDRARIDAAGEIGEVGERLLAARGDDRLDRLAADALERRERVVDRVAFDVELDARSD